MNWTLIAGAGSIAVLVWLIFLASTRKSPYYEFCISYVDDDGISNEELKQCSARKYFNKEIVEIMLPATIHRQPDIPVGKWVALSSKQSLVIIQELPQVTEGIDGGDDICVSVQSFEYAGKKVS